MKALDHYPTLADIRKRRQYLAAEARAMRSEALADAAALGDAARLTIRKIINEYQLKIVGQAKREDAPRLVERHLITAATNLREYARSPLPSHVIGTCGLEDAAQENRSQARLDAAWRLTLARNLMREKRALARASD